jgi:hypothetical protein
LNDIGREAAIETIGLVSLVEALAGGLSRALIRSVFA